MSTTVEKYYENHSDMDRINEKLFKDNSSNTLKIFEKEYPGIIK